MVNKLLHVNELRDSVRLFYFILFKFFLARRSLAGLLASLGRGLVGIEHVAY